LRQERSTASVVLVALAALILTGTFPTGVVEELVHTWTCQRDEHALEQRLGSLNHGASHANRNRFSTPTSDPRPRLEPGCHRSRIRALPIDRRGPPELTPA
jgi:hypothetical protein